MSQTEADVQKALETKAKSMGWRPESEYRGDKSKFISAADYVKRGEEYIPFIQAENRKLQGQVSTLTHEVGSLKTLIAANQEAMEGLKEMASEQAKQAAKNARNNLIEELKKARADGDVDREVTIQGEINEANDALRAADKKPPAKSTTTTTENKPTTEKGPGVNSPEWQQFLADNPWFMQNRRMASYATAIAQENASNAEFMALPVEERWKRIAEETKDFFEKSENPRRGSKVEGGGSGRGEGGGGDGPRTYSGMPQDAREACDRFAKRVVGEGKAYKTLAEFQKKYAEEYFNNL